MRVFHIYRIASDREPILLASYPAEDGYQALQAYVEANPKMQPYAKWMFSTEAVIWRPNNE